MSEESGGFKRGQGKVLKGSAEHRIERRRYFEQLIDEFQRTRSSESKCQIVANLGNFAFDPYNYDFFLELDLISLFLAILENPTINHKLVEYALGALVNCSPDIRLGSEIVKQGGIQIVSKYLQDSSMDPAINFKISAITILMYLINDETRGIIVINDLKSCLKEIANKTDDFRLKNLAILFLEDHFNIESK